MKKTTRNFQSVFIKLIFISILIPTTVLSEKLSYDFTSEKIPDTNTTVFYNAKSIYSKDNKPVNFSDSEIYFIVLKNNRNCISCFGEINELVNANKINLHAKFIVVAHIDSTTLDRKRNYSENKKLMPDFDDYFFQYRNNSENYFFDNLGSGYTPEIIIINHGKIFRIPYQEIFEFPSLNISTEFQTKISELLK